MEKRRHLGEGKTIKLRGAEEVSKKNGT